MDEIARVALENEMDLILAHKQSMKLAEIAGLSLAAQTCFATAVSEVSRVVIEEPKNCFLLLGVICKKNAPDAIVAKITDGRYYRISTKNDGYLYAKKLVEVIELQDDGMAAHVELLYKIPAITRVNNELLEKWRTLLNSDHAVSPYEEIKRKNRMLIQLADKVQESEKSYATLTDSLPLIIYTMDNKGDVVYANKWLLEYTGQSIAALNEKKWEPVLHPDEYNQSWAEWHTHINSDRPRKAERRLYNAATGDYRWHTGITTPVTDEAGNVKWNAFLFDIDAAKKMEQALKDNKELLDTKAELELKVAELNQTNKELEQFAYIASHDLQEPLRKINYYSDYLEKKFGSTFSGEGGIFLRNIINSADRMKQLIHDVLAYSTINNMEVFAPVDLNNILNEALQDLEIVIKEKNAVVHTGDMPIIAGNPGQLKQLFENLLSNSFKFTIPEITPVITVSSKVENDWAVIEFKDNGIGFEEKYLDKMFSIFQRLHTREKFAGTGIGLGICKKIVGVHKGEIIAKSQPGEGAIFIVKLPVKQLY